MKNFRWYNPTQIIFGKGVLGQMGAQAAALGQRALLLYGGGSIRRNGVYDQVTASLQAAGIPYTELGGVQPNPRLSLVYEGVRLVREHQLDMVLCVGGGSVIDSGKAIAMGAVYDGDVWDFYGRGVQSMASLPVGVALTIPAAGSESSDGSVITNEDGWYKRSCCCDLQYPRFALLDPQVCFTLPKAQIAAGGVDMLAHIMERYFSKEPHTDLSDRLCESAMLSLMTWLPRVMENPRDYDAWAEIMWGGNVAHNGLLGRGREEDWASHAIEHELSARYDIAHGAGLAIVFPAWMRYVYHEDLPRFTQFARRVMGVSLPDSMAEAAALEGIARLERFFLDLGAPIRLHEAGIDDAFIPDMALKCCGDWTLGSFRRLNRQDVEAILRLAL